MKELGQIVMRHRSTIKDGSGLLSVIAVAAVVAFLFDFTGSRSIDARIDLNELLVLGLLLSAGVFWFGGRRILEQEREIKAKTEAERRAEFLAHHDHLTGLPNRRRLQQELLTAVEILPTENATHALLLLDLNGFKRINDVYGHASGDEVLSIVASRISSILGPEGLIARTGGDEFAIVLKNVRLPNGPAETADKIIAALSPPINVGSDLHFVGTGIGIALIPREGRRPGELMRKADVALYKSKALGQTGFAFFDEQMDREIRERDHLQHELAAACNAKVIVPFYQPIVDLKTGHVRAFEALARWEHTTLGAVPPERFIPLAEECGLIRDLSDALLQRACEDAVSWPADIGLSFNISPVTLRDRTFGLRILGILGASGLSANRLELEITESAITRDLDVARDSLTALRSAGVRVVLDDFGTGATSLAHLRSFKFDGIKIDRRFVDLMLQEGESATIVKAIMGLAKGLGLTIVAEGIEEMAQSAALQDEGCKTGQGFFFGRAVPADEIGRLFAGKARRVTA